MPGLYREAWVDNFVGLNDANLWNTRFLKDCVDWKAYVENKRINVAFLTDSPPIITTPTYPLVPQVGANTADYIELNNLATEPRVFPPSLMDALAVDPKNPTMERMRKKLMSELDRNGIYSASPNSNTLDTPIITTPNGNSLGADGYRVITDTEIQNLSTAFFGRFPAWRGQKVVLQVPTSDFNALLKANGVLLGQEQYSGQYGKGYNFAEFVLFGITIVPDDRTPVYTNANVRTALGTAPVPGTNRKSATLYVPQVNVGRAYEDVEFFTEMSALYQGELLSCRLWGYAGANCNNVANLKMFGAITKTN